MPSPISAPPCLIETYCITPELSAGSLPPYNPLVSEAGIPSICNSVTSPENEHGALPNTNKPPHKPLTFSFNDDPAVCPTVISSDSEVITIGALAVPSAINFPPLATTKEEAFAPVPALALIIVPAGIVKVTPLGTITLPSKIHTTEASNVWSAAKVPDSLYSVAANSQEPSSLVASEL